MWDARGVPRNPAGGAPAAAVATSAALTRVVTGGLVLVAAAVVVSASGPVNNTSQRAQVAANTRASLVLSPGMPGAGYLRSVQRTGDVVTIRVDPVGDLGTQSLVVASGAVVSGRTGGGALTLQQLLDQLADPARAASLRSVAFRVGYDDYGQVSSLTAPSN